VSLPNEEVLDLLDDRFVLCHANIEREEHVGLSHGYKTNQSAVGTTNGAGGRNVQFVVLADDETVVHALPGFWHAGDLVQELLLGLELHSLYRDENLAADSKQALFGAMHRRHLREYGPVAEKRGQWQSFDRHAELQRVQTETRDTFTQAADGTLVLKTIPQIVHDRLLQRGFKQLDDFDMEAFVDYGRAYYDNNMGHDRGKKFSRAERANREREEAEREAAEQAERDAAKAEREARRKRR
jgi:hypothetical protein